MTTVAPTFGQIKARVAAIRQKVSNARVIGIQAPGRWTGDPLRPDGDETFVIYQCDSPLAMRLALRDPIDAKATKVLVTSLDLKELSDDILVRLARRKLYQIDNWEIVRSLFQAHVVDPRLVRHSWIADALLEAVPSGELPAARGGFLDAEAVWSLLLDRVIGLSADVPDMAALLKWSTSAEAVERFRRSSDAFRAGAIQWLTERIGPVGEAVLCCAQRLERPDALPLGLAAAVVFHPDAAGRLEKATGKLEERFFGGTPVDSRVIARWGAVATEVVRLQLKDSKLKRQQLHRADEILREIGADSFAYLSDTSPSGFDQRLARFGSVLSGCFSGARWTNSTSCANIGRRSESTIRRRARTAAWIAWRWHCGSSAGYAGRAARRLVVLVSDHAHVLDSRTAYRPHEGGERWRVDVGRPESNELRIEGSRVLAEGGRLIAPWSEQVRYGGKRNGYHGGLTPQEMVVPIAVLTSMDSIPEGWSEAGVETPAWWDEPLEGAVQIEETEPELSPAKPRPAGVLFDLDTMEDAAPSKPQPDAPDQNPPDWISHVLACPVFADQKRMGGRAVPERTNEPPYHIGDESSRMCTDPSIGPHDANPEKCERFSARPGIADCGSGSCSASIWKLRADGQRVSEALTKNIAEGVNHSGRPRFVAIGWQFNLR